jgi:histidinol-phosphate phosphatase family protein
VRFYPWSIDAVRALNRAGLKVAIVTNQSGVARGYFGVEAVDAVHRHIDAQLAAAGARIDAYYYCPHHPEGRVAWWTVRQPISASTCGSRSWSAIGGST